MPITRTTRIGRGVGQGDGWGGGAKGAGVGGPARGYKRGNKGAAGETDALRRGNDRGVDADHAPAAADQRTAGIPRIERCVSLDHAVDPSSRSGAQAAAERTNDAGGDRALEAERIARSRRRAAPRATSPNSQVRRGRGPSRPAGARRDRSPDRRRPAQLPRRGHP